ncbi:ADP-ribosylglycohydrolase family protein [Paenibacillus sacheonensis]|uniref:ADP-ribosylglycohydrolase family protein n=1 Tax=Paenibacillus sacheonensis TaxID=742054 RepID=A0A7X4YR28_9BACL|nr:ADP-ribosylglycohydrolase family protein [Paenibacillus sacheonensis]MBM7565220.1 ADP-ribosylglycohydrolase [Paenibacillus sacheonensis]NBC70004.1 ADP-ribosylglycohydrolase family protein [Paenibacillus sacheonensis]
MAGWDSLFALVKEEVKQRGEEGCSVEGFAERVQAAGEDEAELMKLYRELMALPIAADFPYSEPSELEDIRAQRPAAVAVASPAWTDAQWLDKFNGAWLGRAAGCALGKPLEAGPFMNGSGGRSGAENVKLWFEGANAWPIQGYTPIESESVKQYPDLHIAMWCKDSTREHIRFMETDDDIRYTVLGLAMLEERGTAFDSWDVGKMWHNRLSYGQVCTAETQAYLNFARITSHMRYQKDKFTAEDKDWVRTYLNPYREWIGAQIRVDGYAYGAAGNPDLAAELAWKDSSFSHIKNGIYGAMFCAAMIAAAFVETDVRRIVDIGLGVIPANSRLASDIKLAIEIAESTNGQVELTQRIWDAFCHYDAVHTNNNAALCAAALIYSGGDYEKGITTAVLGGWDTDCNGATVGSILGAMLGGSALPSSWTAPLNDQLYAAVNGFHPIAISECARRSYEVFRKLQAVPAV